MTSEDLIPILSNQTDMLLRIGETNELLLHLCTFDLFVIGTAGALLVLFLLYKFLRLFF